MEGSQPCTSDCVAQYISHYPLFSSNQIKVQVPLICEMDESEPKIDVETLIRRLTSLYSSWEENRNQFWGSSTVFFVLTPTSSHDVRLLNKSLAFCTWLLGYELPGVLMVFSHSKIHFLCSEDDALLIHAARHSVKEALDIDFVMHVREENQDGSTRMDKILHAVGSKCILGYMPTEASSMLKKWRIKVKDLCIKVANVTNGVANLMFVRDAPGLLSQKKAASITASAMKKIVVPMLEKVMNQGEKVKHSWLMRETGRAMLDPSLLTKNLNPEVLRFVILQFFKVGGNLISDLKLQAMMIILITTTLDASSSALLGSAMKITVPMWLERFSSIQLLPRMKIIGSF